MLVFSAQKNIFLVSQLKTIDTLSIIFWFEISKNVIKYVDFFSSKNIFLLSQKIEKYRYFIDLILVWNLQKCNKICWLFQLKNYIFLVSQKLKNIDILLILFWSESSRNTIKYVDFSAQKINFFGFAFRSEKLENIIKVAYTFFSFIMLHIEISDYILYIFYWLKTTGSWGIVKSRPSKTKS